MSKKTRAPLPTHADELDVLRLHNAALVMQDAKAKALAAEAEFAKLLGAAEKKYRFEHAKGEGVDFNTRAIVRVTANG